MAPSSFIIPYQPQASAGNLWQFIILKKGDRASDYLLSQIMGIVENVPAILDGLAGPWSVAANEGTGYRYLSGCTLVCSCVHLSALYKFIYFTLADFHMVLF